MNTLTLKDKLGRRRAVGDRIAYASHYNLGMTLGTVIKLGRVRAEVAPEVGSWRTEHESITTTDLIKV